MDAIQQVNATYEAELADAARIMAQSQPWTPTIYQHHLQEEAA